MMMLNSNKQRLYYALQDKEVPIYERDSDGNIVYVEVDGEQIPVETGETELGYGQPTPFFANIAFGSNETTAQEFGINLADYDAQIVMSKGEIPITETSILWYETRPRTMPEDSSIADKDSRDYEVVAVKPSLNEVKYLLKHVAK